MYSRLDAEMRELLQLEQDGCQEVGQPQLRNKKEIRDKVIEIACYEKKVG
jgi:hypothetical protein